MTKFFLFCFLILFSFSTFASSCEKNGTCKKRFSFQGDPIDFERESSRAHISTFLVLNFAANRLLETTLVTDYLGRSLTKTERIFYSTTAMFLGGLIKEVGYDPDGISTSDLVNNTIGLGLSVSLELTAF